MTKDEAERLARRKNDAPGHKAAKDGWRYKAAAVGSKVAGGYVVQRQRGDASACELYRTNIN